MNRPRRTALFLVLAMCGCAATTVRDRMPAAASTVAWSLDEAGSELEKVRSEIDASGLDASVSRALHAECDQVDAQLFDLRVELDRVESSADADRFEQLTGDLEPVFEQIEELRAAVHPQPSSDPR